MAGFCEYGDEPSGSGATDLVSRCSFFASFFLSFFLSVYPSLTTLFHTFIAERNCIPS
jgi:hypothetical protein